MEILPSDDGSEHVDCLNVRPWVISIGKIFVIRDHFVRMCVLEYQVLHKIFFILVKWEKKVQKLLQDSFRNYTFLLDRYINDVLLKETCK